MKHLLLIAAFTTAAHADRWTVVDDHGSVSMSKPDCYRQDWVTAVAAQHPTIVIDSDRMVLNGSTVMASFLIAGDYAIGFVDAPDISDHGVTLVVRVNAHDIRADVDIMFIKRLSNTDRGNACYVAWHGKAER